MHVGDAEKLPAYYTGKLNMVQKERKNLSPGGDGKQLWLPSLGHLACMHGRRQAPEPQRAQGAAQVRLPNSMLKGTLICLLAEGPEDGTSMVCGTGGLTSR